MTPEPPLEQCLAGFWLPGPPPPDAPAPGDEGTWLDERGPSSVRVRGRDLREVLRPAYDAFTDDGAAD